MRELRDEVASILGGAGLVASAQLPDRISPPVAIVTHGSPLATPGPTFATFTARLVVLLVVARSDNATVYANLESMAEDAIVALVNEGYTIEQLGPASAAEIGQVEYPAMELTITKEITL